MSIPNAVSVSQLYHLVATPECPSIIDVRIPEDFDDDPRIIPGAFKRNFDDIAGLAEEFSEERLVIYCQKGLKISQGTAAHLRQIGVAAAFLEGGQFGWRDAKFPMVTASNIPRATAECESVWVTHDRAKINPIACAWLIRRFVDPRAKMLFVEPSQVTNVAERFDATPFDVEDVKFSQRAELCSFDIMVEEFGLGSSAPLRTLAQILRAAETKRHDLAPEAAGLFALSVGLSHMYCDDLARLDAGMQIYDAYYRWARDGKSEDYEPTPTHN